MSPSLTPRPATSCAFQLTQFPIAPAVWNRHEDLMNHRTFFITAALMRAIVSQHSWSAENDFADIKTEIGKRHGEAAKRLQDWIHLPSIAAENRGYPEGVDYMIKLARDAGFQQATRADTDGKPGVFATHDSAHQEPRDTAPGATLVR